MKAVLLAMTAAYMLGTAGCADDPVQNTNSGTFIGESKTLGNGTVKSWVTLDDNGNPTSVGATLSEAALTGLPDSTQQLVLLFPSQASATAYNHIGFDWNPKGHPPFDVYGAAHFDVHFYTITQQQRAGITMTGDDTLKVYKMPAADYIPAGYFGPPETGVPGMGSHWFDTAAHEFQHHDFDKTFIYGFYDGSMAFMEPMITKAHLEMKMDMTENLHLPAKYPKQAYYATKYGIKYDADKKEYTISLDGLTMRQ